MAIDAFAKLGIPEEHHERIAPEAPISGRMAAARGLVPVAPDQLLAMVFALTGDPDRRVARAARKTLRTMPEDNVIQGINVRTHPKLLELLARARGDDSELMEGIYRLSTATNRTACLIAERATGGLIEVIVRNQERLLITPDVYLALHRNSAVPQNHLQRVESFLRLNHCLPELPEEPEVPEEEPDATLGVEDTRSGESSASVGAALSGDPSMLFRLAVEAEVEAALHGLPSPATNPEVAKLLRLNEVQVQAVATLADEQGYDPDNDDDDDEDWAFTPEMFMDEPDPEQRKSMQARIAAMSPGEKIKLAYLGNGESRKLLLRDSNKIVAAAVVKSKRMTDNEILGAAGNRNLGGDIFREIALDKENLRAYPVKVAMANNPKVPVSISVGLVNQLGGADLARLARNKNVPSIISTMALKKVKAKRNG